MFASSDIVLIQDAIDSANKIIAIAHIAPDGDAIGSLTAIGVALQQLRKKFTLVCDDGLPTRFSFLPLADEVKRQADPEMAYDLIIALDASDTERLGRAFASFGEHKPTVINIDHHVTNTLYGQINIVGMEANSTTEVLSHLLPHLDVALTPDLAKCLLTGLVTDTLGFHTAGVNASTLQLASKLIEAGADLFTITTLALDLKPLSTLLIWQKGLSNMRLEEDIIWTSISNQEREEASHNGTSSFGLGNMMANVYHAAMSAVLLEHADGRITVGFRCRPPFSVSELAFELGGGGHHLASGCSLEGPLERAEKLVVGKSKESIRRQKEKLSLQETLDFGLVPSD